MVAGAMESQQGKGVICGGRPSDLEPTGHRRTCDRQSHIITKQTRRDRVDQVTAAGKFVEVRICLIRDGYLFRTGKSDILHAQHLSVHP